VSFRTWNVSTAFAEEMSLGANPYRIGSSGKIVAKSLRFRVISPW
jgi:hypothetical protein